MYDLLFFVIPNMEALPMNRERYFAYSFFSLSYSFV